VFYSYFYFIYTHIQTGRVGSVYAPEAKKNGKYYMQLNRHVHCFQD